MRIFATLPVLALCAAAPVLAQDGFPVTLEHAFGETVIAAKPERIVTIGWMTQDAVIALGETPVAIPFQGWGGDENGYVPWVVEALEARGESLPELINTDQAIPFEQILALDPDVILAPYSDLSDSDYARLAAIAPTVAYVDGPWSGSWQYVVETVGAALGQPQEAAALVAETQDRLESYKDTYPQIEGPTFIFGGGGIVETNTVDIYLPFDPRVQLLADLGLVPAPALDTLSQDTFYQSVSAEQIGTLEADVYVGWFNSEQEVEAALAHPLFARWAPIAAGRFVALPEAFQSLALSAPSPLSLPWVMDQFVPQLAEALE
ncbi:iron-siderophore ABC transporter substrate-binding protein [Pelagibacterium lacus]|nr:iron-siderophore ABC transporter substrate-binding protein [Pelagibacterium lacus]